jgi:hypothetical protein
MDIETKHASLDTLAVTIQALHVNGKQMTLAVFRQLPELQLWGRVRYTIPGEFRNVDMWIVGSRQGKLYRVDADLMSAYQVMTKEDVINLPQLFIAV